MKMVTYAQVIAIAEIVNTPAQLLGVLRVFHTQPGLLQTMGHAYMYAERLSTASIIDSAIKLLEVDR